MTSFPSIDLVSLLKDDRVNWTCLKKSLEWAKIPDRMTKWITGLYKDLKARIMGNKLGREDLKINQGLR